MERQQEETSAIKRMLREERKGETNCIRRVCE